MENTRPKDNIPKYLLLVAAPIELKTMGTQNTLQTLRPCQSTLSCYWWTTFHFDAQLLFLQLPRADHWESLLLNSLCISFLWKSVSSFQPEQFTDPQDSAITFYFTHGFQSVENLKREAGLLQGNPWAYLQKRHRCAVPLRIWVIVLLLTVLCFFWSHFILNHFSSSSFERHTKKTDVT